MTKAELLLKEEQTTALAARLAGIARKCAEGTGKGVGLKAIVEIGEFGGYARKTVTIRISSDGASIDDIDGWMPVGVQNLTVEGFWYVAEDIIRHGKIVKVHWREYKSRWIK